MTRNSIGCKGLPKKRKTPNFNEQNVAMHRQIFFQVLMQRNVAVKTLNQVVTC